MAPRLTQLTLLAAAVSACLTGWELEGRLPPDNVHMRRQVTTTTPIGKGNRWEDDVPRGLGTQPGDTVITHIMNPTEIRAAVDSLAEEFDLDVFEMPEETHDGAIMFGGKLGASCPRSILTAGIHARERGGPDNLVYLIADLLWAQREETGLTYGGWHFTNDDVNKVLANGILFVPLQNPDGVEHDQANNDCWRKNRNPDGAVDLNRNFDYLWDFKTKFSPEVADSVASEDPKVETYHGTEVFSEPESRNIRWLLDEHLSLTWAMDVHSMASVVGYSWGDDNNQYTDPNMNMLNETYDGMRGLQRDGEDTQYRAYQDPEVWKSDAFVTARVASAMMGSAGSTEIPAIQIVNLYPTSGDISDYVSARHIIEPDKPRAHGLTMEFGMPSDDVCPFYMMEKDFNDNIRQVGAGLMEFLVAAADEGDNGVECGGDDSNDEEGSGGDGEDDSDSENYSP